MMGGGTGAAEAAAQEKAAVYQLRSCVWEITLACCFRCKYCGSSGGKARENELTTAECLDVAGQLSELGCRRVSMIGGEVFMRRDWAEIAGALTSRGIAVNIITNGFLFTGALLDRLQELNIESIAVSLDGPREVHDKYRQAGSFDRAVRAIEALTGRGILTSVITTLNSENVKLLPEFYKTLKAFPIFAWQLQACSPMGNAANNGIDYSFDPLRVVRFVSGHLREAPFSIRAADNIGYFTEEENLIRGGNTPLSVYPGCSAGLLSVGIDSVGNVRGCESMYDERFNEGNLRERSLADIWNDPDAFAYNRKFSPDMLTGACAGCAVGQWCAGGCRSYNYFVHGKLYETPRCARNEI